ncbi:hypothetical protein C5468_06955 [Photorhabdus luminescens subsp. mexicana]|uniref:Uncharacterized protein n=1 Tax=Photorhabdus luminescens subsp. mexicana TaxID=2100167 RepID=A0A4R4JJZ0_PHOLU|nr:hypothetical protein C5468_06955 [Photorhabdus luminescens subsp. mexicana]
MVFRHKKQTKRCLWCIFPVGQRVIKKPFIPVIFQVASLLAALAHPGHIVRYAPGDSHPLRLIVSQVDYKFALYQ